MEVIQKKGPVPIYHQLQEIILRHISTDEWSAGEAIPSERELSDYYGVSRMTVRHALSDLARQGVLRREIGKGTFVVGPRITQTLDALTGFSAEMWARGRVPKTRVVSLMSRAAGHTVADALRIDPTQEVVIVERLRLADEDVVALECSHLWFAGCEGLLQDDLTGSLYALLTGRYGVIPTRARQVIGAGPSGHREGQLLSIPQGTAVLLLKRTVLEQNQRPFEYVESVYRADRYAFVAELVHAPAQSG